MMRENFFPTRNSCKNITSNATFFDNFKFWQQSQNICIICKESKLREFYYKFLHRIIATKKELYCFGIKSNKDCLYCNESQSIGHTFIDCHQSKYFFQYVLEWFNSEHATSYSLSTEEFLFGKLDNTQLARSDGTLKKLNYCLLFAKYYLYCQKLNKRKINFHKFKQRIAFKFRIEGLS